MDAGAIEAPVVVGEGEVGGESEVVGHPSMTPLGARERKRPLDDPWLLRPFTVLASASKQLQLTNPEKQPMLLI